MSVTTHQGILFPPKSSWAINEKPLDMSKAKCGVLAVDLETHDPELLTMGPGAVRGSGYVCGLAMATDSEARYYPLQHPESRCYNIAQVEERLGEAVKNARVVVFANALYDLEWLRFLGIEMPPKKIRDIQVLEPLLDEEQDSYSLDSLSFRYLGKRKEERLLREAAEAYDVDPKAGIGSLPARYVGPYAEEDALLTAQIYLAQEARIRLEGLEQIAELETRLIPLLLDMRWRGVPFNQRKSVQVSKSLGDKQRALEAELFSNGSFDIWSNLQIAERATALGLDVPKTSKNNPSFNKEFLASANHPFFTLLKKIREVDRLRSVFVESLNQKCILGRIHCQWRQLASDEGGTRTGRMAASYPNLQQIPSRNEYAKLVRSLFHADEDHRWAKLDYSQQEPRLVVHYAVKAKLSLANNVKEAYERGIDFYSFLEQEAGIERRHAKVLTLGSFYGMGALSVSEQLNLPTRKAYELISEFNTHYPFVRELSELCKNRAEACGKIRTLGGRVRHFNKYRPSEDYINRELDRQDGKNHGNSAIEMMRDKAARYKAGWSLERAKELFPDASLVRAHTRKALNSLIQGSGADMIKRAMVIIYEKMGLVPYLQVHDELDYPIKDKEQGEAIKELMETTTPLVVPTVAELVVGDTWS